MEKYALNLGENGRVLSVCVCIEGQTYENIVDSFPDGDVSEYRYMDGEFIHDPDPKPEPTAQEPTQLDELEAQVVYTAMMTDTVLKTEA